MLGETTRCANSTPPLTKPTLSEVNVAVGNLFPDSVNTKRCSCCKSTKPVSEFNKSKPSKDGLAYRCRDCGKAQCRAWNLKNIDAERERSRNRMRIYGPKQRAANKLWALQNPERARYHSRKKLLGKKYGMTIEEHDALFASQGFACGACGSDSPNSKKGWSTDHCHETGKVRGILCHHCNVGLGHAKDDVGALRAWIAYLEKSKSP